MHRPVSGNPHQRRQRLHPPLASSPFAAELRSVTIKPAAVSDQHEVSGNHPLHRVASINTQRDNRTPSTVDWWSFVEYMK